MSEKFLPLKPGDLITADLMNAILNALNSLDARLAAVEKRLTQSAKPKPVPPRPAKRHRKI